VEAGEVQASQNQCSMRTGMAGDRQIGGDMRAHWVERGEVSMGSYGQQEGAWKRGRCGQTKTSAACAPG
jgi:hypothetical protein